MAVYVKVNDRGNRVGDSHGRAKFSDHEVDMMRQLHEGGMSCRDIARKFEANDGYVSRVLRYQYRATTAILIRVPGGDE